MNHQQFWNTTAGEFVLWVVSLGLALGITALLASNLVALETSIVFTVLLVAFVGLASWLTRHTPRY